MPQITALYVISSGKGAIGAIIKVALWMNLSVEPGWPHTSFAYVICTALFRRRLPTLVDEQAGPWAGQQNSRRGCVVAAGTGTVPRLRQPRIRVGVRRPSHSHFGDSVVAAFLSAVAVLLTLRLSPGLCMRSVRSWLSGGRGARPARRATEDIGGCVRLRCIRRC